MSLFFLSSVHVTELFVQIIASARSCAEVSKQLAALDHAVCVLMSQSGSRDGLSDNAEVLKRLQASFNSAEAQVSIFSLLAIDLRSYCQRNRRMPLPLLSIGTTTTT